MIDAPVQPDLDKTAPQISISDRILNRLSRVTSSGRFVPEIDGLRFFAIFGVLLGHVCGLVASNGIYASSQVHATFLVFLLDNWTHGVHLFFSISGFILSLPFAESHLFGKSRPELAKYYVRRVTRLEPPYIIALIVGLVGVCVYESSLREQIAHFFASLVYLHAIIYHEPSTIGGILWSLEIEAQFYILAPFLTQVFRLSNAVVRRGAIVLAIAAAMFLQRQVDGSPWFIHLTLLGNIQYFLVGFLAADVYLFHWSKPRQQSFTWDALFISVYTAILLLTFYVSVKWFYCSFPMVIFLVYVASFRGRIISRIMCNRWLVVIGGMCYTIYLYHMITIRTMWVTVTHRLMVTDLYTVDYLIQLVILMPILLVVSSLLFIAFEKPFMQRDWPKRWRSAISSFLARKGIAPADK